MKPNWHYYEAHITVKESSNPQKLLSRLRDLNLKVVDLVNINIEGLNNEEGIITTLHGSNLAHLTEQVRQAVQKLQLEDYTVLRYKIESTVLDSKHDDKLQLLKQ